MSTAPIARRPHPLQLVDPGPEEMVLPAERVRPGTNPDLLPRFGDPYWPYTFIEASETSLTYAVNWEKFPETFRASLRRTAWALFNLPAPEALDDTHLRAVVAAGSYDHVFKGWLDFTRWLQDEDIDSISDITADDLEAYAQSLPALGRTWGHNYRMLNTLTRMWAYAPYLLPQDRLVMPPWEEPAAVVTDFLGINDDAPDGENTTAVIHPGVMSPLLVWAARTITDFAPDILAAQRERQRLLDRIPTKAQTGGRGKVLDYVQRDILTGTKLLPRYRGGKEAILKDPRLTSHHRMQREANLNKRMLAATLQVTKGQIDRALARLPPLQDHHFAAGSPLEVPITGAIDGRPWTDGIDFDEVADLRVRMTGAALVLVGYLSGMRPQEFLHLERGCCTTQEQPGGTLRYKITGRHFKGVTDEDGNRKPEGEIRLDPWVVIEVVQRAIDVMEQAHDEQMLFPRNLTVDTRKHGPRGTAFVTQTAKNHIASFIKWANQMALAHNRPYEVIPEDPNGAITVQRFRRTIAWHIYRQPGGQIALGVQYGHVATAMGESYAGRSRADMLELLDYERGLAMADTLATAAERIDEGEGISGPAAGRYIAAASEFQNKFAGTYMSSSALAALRDNPRLQVYESPHSFMTCNHDAFKALCDPEQGNGAAPQRTPNHSRCNPACANISRTDSQIDNARREVTEIDIEIESGINPKPIDHRLQQRKIALLKIVERHEAERIVPTQPRKDTSDH